LQYTATKSRPNNSSIATAPLSIDVRGTSHRDGEGLGVKLQQKTKGSAAAAAAATRQLRKKPLSKAV